ncbi:hypothetical protein [Mesorhizobium sp. CO1-1-8]|uniref:hypothetical protein n=1 Tax=Mesorhizobium sp. CO1-1-8 TaxID=2876631 RepID=UPI001CD10974|nr:hypothetical protein [Mesorhizobium sp. CO1-1-8]MBZ9771466.1 hypothetical protein [Mesorhizobium sp. CO1-1-8]
MTSHASRPADIYLPHDQWTALVDALVDAHTDFDPRNAIIIALAEVGFIVPDTCREDVSLQEAA